MGNTQQEQQPQQQSQSKEKQDSPPKYNPGHTEILQIIFDPDKKPTEKEILEHAKYLGMDEEYDKDLFDIARHCLTQPLQADWKYCKTADGVIFYHNFKTNQSTWNNPNCEHYSKVFLSKKEQKIHQLRKIHQEMHDNKEKIQIHIRQKMKELNQAKNQARELQSENQRLMQMKKKIEKGKY